MAVSIDRAAVEQELAFVEVSIQTIRTLPPWRLFHAWELVGDIRGGLRRAMTLARHKGSLWLDIRTWLPSILLALFPFDVLAKAVLWFGVFTAAVGTVLTFTTQETKQEAYTESVSRERTSVRRERRWIFWTKEVPITESYTEQVTKHRDVTVILPHTPASWVAPTITAVVLLATSLAIVWGVKRFWAWRAERWVFWLRRVVAEAEHRTPSQ